MILILKKYGYGRRSFTENCRMTKIKEERRYRHHEPVAQTFKQTKKTYKNTEKDKDTQE
jgi:hypothetical protein